MNEKVFTTNLRSFNDSSIGAKQQTSQPHFAQVTSLGFSEIRPVSSHESQLSAKNAGNQDCQDGMYQGGGKVARFITPGRNAIDASLPGFPVFHRKFGNSTIIGLFAWVSGIHTAQRCYWWNIPPCLSQICRRSIPFKLVYRASSRCHQAQLGSRYCPRTWRARTNSCRDSGMGIGEYVWCKSHHFARNALFRWRKPRAEDVLLSGKTGCVVQLVWRVLAFFLKHVPSFPLHFKAY